MTKYTPQASSTQATTSFGTHRQSDRPASAVRAGATTMPAAWQSRGVATGDQFYVHGAQVRSFADQALDPFRWSMATPLRKVASIAILLTVAIFVF